MAPASAWLGPCPPGCGEGASRLGKSLRSHSEFRDRANRVLSRGAPGNRQSLERPPPEHGFLLESPDEDGDEIRLQGPAAHGQLSASFSNLYAREPEALHGLPRKGAEVFRVSGRSSRTACPKFAQQRLAQSDRRFDAPEVLIELPFAFFRAELRSDFCELLLLLLVGAPRFSGLARQIPVLPEGKGVEDRHTQHDQSDRLGHGHRGEIFLLLEELRIEKIDLLAHSAFSSTRSAAPNRWKYSHCSWAVGSVPPAKSMTSGRAAPTTGTYSLPARNCSSSGSCGSGASNRFPTPTLRRWRSNMSSERVISVATRSR